MHTTPLYRAAAYLRVDCPNTVSRCDIMYGTLSGQYSIYIDVSGTVGSAL